jgi:hypothetical protein
MVATLKVSMTTISLLPLDVVVSRRVSTRCRGWDYPTYQTGTSQRDDRPVAHGTGRERARDAGGGGIPAPVAPQGGGPQC